jgi:GNAT superfamily N-acetyltransferase
MSQGNKEDTRVHVAVMNDEEQYSICLADRQLSPGRRNANRKGTIIIEPAADAATVAAADHVREEVFGREWNHTLPPLSNCDPAQMLTLVARTEVHAEPIAALTVLDTTADSEVHHRFELPFEGGVRVARYTRLAVLKPYRGLNVPLQLILEAQRRFVATAEIEYTWLLFDAKRAESSSICRLLGFRASARTFRTEYGLSRVLWRNEFGAGACQSNESAQQFLNRSRCGCHSFAASTAGQLVGQERTAVCGL